MNDKIEIDNKLLNDAIDKAQTEIKTKPKVIPKKEKPQVTVTQTKKVKDKTIKVTEKKSFKEPSVFKNHPLAKSINKIVDSVILEDGFCSEVDFGESCVLTIDYYMAEIPDHPLFFLAVAGGMVAFKGLSNRGILPDLLGFLPKGETSKAEKDKEENAKYEHYKLRNTKSPAKMKIDTRIEETKEYKQGAKK